MNNIIYNIGFNGAVNLFYGTIILMCIKSFNGSKIYNILDICYVFIWQCFPHFRKCGIVNNFTGINYYFNGVLKNLFKQPRPTNIKFIHPSDVKNSKEYGMPSGHAQLTSSMMTFLILEFNDPYISTISIIQLFLTLNQRYVYGMHTISQLVFGSIIGCLSGGLFYILFSKYKTNQCIDLPVYRFTSVSIYQCIDLPRGKKN